jgi:DMATS type aromatic prenyltransferase
VGFDPEKLIPQKTYVEAGIEKLTALSEALGMADKTAEMVAIFRGMTTSWGDKKVGDTSGWQSDVSDDLSPFEFSIAFKENRAELRVLLEAQGQEPTLESNWQAGLELNQYLAENFNINLDRFEQIKDLYIPTDAKGKLAMWHAVCFYPDKAPEFKLYLNPQAQGTSKAAAVVEESLVRLRFTHAWIGLAEVAAQRGPDQDQFVYFSLDLAADDRARVKVYLRHYDATAEDLEKALSLAENHVAGEATEFCEAMAEGQNVFSAKPAITCFAWVEGDNFTPSNGTVYLPISNYATDDSVVGDRLGLYFSQYKLPSSQYHSAIQAFATRSLDTGIGMHSYVALRPQSNVTEVNIYLNPELSNVYYPRKIETAENSVSKASVVEKVWKYYEDNTIADHPFLQRLKREPVNPQHLWLLFTNFHAAVNNFTRRLALVISRINDERICSILAKQLNEELGDGDIDRIHKKMYDRLMININHWRIPAFNESMLIPGNRFSDSLEDIYSNYHPYEAVGSAILMEIQAKQFDICVGEEFRKTDIDLASIEWLVLHEELEIDHADETQIVARLADDYSEGIIPAIQGAMKARVASWKLLDGMYRLCYG